VGLISLRGREGEPAVRSLLTEAHGTPDSVDRAVARYRSREWILVGWKERDDVVACAGVERDGDDIVVRSVAVVPARRRKGVGRALVNALVDVATASRLVAETDEDAVGFYRRCGFAVEEVEPRDGRARFRCSRVVETEAVQGERVRASTLAEVEAAIRDAWSRETSDDPEEWSEQNAARGQCAVTALVVRDLLGAEILIANVLRDGRRVERHAWNLLASGLELDLTRSQFVQDEEFEQPRPGEPVLVDPARYALLTERVRARLALS
jgi:GNAT superfamily N-acetyltransferase